MSGPTIVEKRWIPAFAGMTKQGSVLELVDLDGARIDKLLITPAPPIEMADDEQ